MWNDTLRLNTTNASGNCPDTLSNGNNLLIYGGTPDMNGQSETINRLSRAVGIVRRGKLGDRHVDSPLSPSSVDNEQGAGQAARAMIEDFLGRIFFNQWAILGSVSLLLLALAETGCRFGLVSRQRDPESVSSHSDSRG